MATKKKQGPEPPGEPPGEEAPRKRRGLSILGRDESSTPWTRVLRDHGARMQARERAYRCRGVLGRTRALGLSHLPPTPRRLRGFSTKPCRIASDTGSSGLRRTPLRRRACPR